MRQPWPEGNVSIKIMLQNYEISPAVKQDFFQEQLRLCAEQERHVIKIIQKSDFAEFALFAARAELCVLKVGSLNMMAGVPTSETPR